MKQVVIIGNGIAGVTAARYIRKLSDYQITIISAESKHFWSRTALMYIYMGHMKYEHTKPYEDQFWSKNRIELIQDYVNKVSIEEKKVSLNSGGEISYDKLIIASGSMPNKFGWPGEKLDGVCGMVSLQDLEKIERYTKGIKKGVIIGGGLIGIELAEMLLSRNIEVSFLVRENSFWNHILPPEESEMINNHIRDHHIDLRLETELDKILGDDKGRVKGIVTKDGQTIDCQFVGLTVGVHPQITFLKESGIECDRGVLVDEHLQTNIEDIYAIGDCAQHIKPPEGRRPLEQIWYTGKIQGKTVAHTICGSPQKYNPGLFYNSAKFLDVEYQIYGEVPTVETDKVRSFYWEDEKGKRAIRIIFSSEDLKVKGFNLMGIRYRQAVCEEWISTGAEINKVMNELERANFDPEFHKKHERIIKTAFQETFPEITILQEKKRDKILGLF